MIRKCSKKRNKSAVSRKPDKESGSKKKKESGSRRGVATITAG